MVSSCVTPASPSPAALGSGAGGDSNGAAHAAAGGAGAGAGGLPRTRRASSSAAAVTRHSLSTFSYASSSSSAIIVLVFVVIVLVMPRVDDAEVMFTSIASPNACHTQEQMSRREGRQNGGVRGEETGSESTWAMNGRSIRKADCEGEQTQRAIWPPQAQAAAGGCKPVQSTGSSSAGGPGYLPIATHRSNTPPPEHRLNMWELS